MRSLYPVFIAVRASFLAYFRTCGLIGCLFFSSIQLIWGQYPQSFKTPLSPRIANYNIQLRLDTTLKKVTAKQKITFKNPSADTIWSMPMHLYYNAFKNNRSSFALEARGFFSRKSKEAIEAGQWPWIKVQQAKDAFGNNLTDSLFFIAPEDQNPNDHTVLELRLKTPILPYQSYVVDLEWQSHIPQSGVRTGYNRDYYFMAQWYPKLGVYEPAGTRFAKKGQWNCHQYHANTEYYGDFGVYEVEMQVPKGYIVGASGFLIAEKEEKNYQSYTYRAEDVIDFTWTASPKFEIIKENWKGVEIKLMIMPEHLCNQSRFLYAAKYALNFFEEYIEKYPYPTMTIVSPPYYGLFSGAMEYPTLFTAPTLCLLPSNIRTTETLTMHELTHQYFMQMLATNEQEEAWMDEGFTAFFEAKMMDQFYPKGVFHWDYMGVNLGSEEYRRGRFFNSVNIQAGPMSQAGWLFKHGGHREIVYGKAAVGLKTLEGLVGATCMKDIIRTYFQRWKFKHPCRTDFVDVVLEIVPKHHGLRFGEVIGDYMQQLIYETSVCDYSVQSIENRVYSEPLGFFEQLDQAKTPSKDAAEQYESKVILFRLGNLRVPQEVRITFDDGSTILENWDGQAPSHDFTYVSSKKIVSAELDPFGKIPLDKNLINNSYTLEPDPTGIQRYFYSFMSWMQNTIVSASALI